MRSCCATCDEYRSIYESQTKNQAQPEELVKEADNNETEANPQERRDEQRPAPREPQTRLGKAEPDTIKRIFGYIFQYKWRVVAIVICILIGAAAQAGSALFLQSPDRQLHPAVVGEEHPDWSPLLRR